MSVNRNADTVHRSACHEATRTAQGSMANPNRGPKLSQNQDRSPTKSFAFASSVGALEELR